MFMKFIRWIADIFVGDDGRASHKRVIATFFAGLVGYMIFSDKIPPAQRVNAFYALLTTIGILIGVVTIAQVLMFFGRDKPEQVEKQNDPEVIKVGDQITIQKEDS